MYTIKYDNQYNKTTKFGLISQWRKLNGIIKRSINPKDGRKEKKRTKKRGQIRNNNKVVHLNLKISIVTINIKGLITTNKSRLFECSF